MPVRPQASRFSQGDEQKWVTEYFGMTGSFVEGRQQTFLDLGANDGETLSNTRALALKGWRGLCVDASPLAAQRLMQLYRDSETVQTYWTGVGEEAGTMTFWESGTHLKNGDVGLLSTFNEADMLKWKTSGEEFTKTMVPVVTVAQLLDAARVTTFDFISIDIEGKDLCVLQQLDLTALQCKMVIVEVNAQDTTPFVAHCRKHGLRYVRRNGENLCFQR